MSNLAIIPARGGSKRIPRKNIKPFLGKPIIAYSIELALESGLFDEVMVSTEDDEIADVARDFGASVPFMRSAETADDYAGLPEVMLEVLEEYNNSKNRLFDYVCCILPTAPLICQKHLKRAYEMISSGNFDAVLPVTAFSFPILRSVRFNDEGFLVINWPDHFEKRSQDLPKNYHDTGTFYWVKGEKFMQDGELFPPRSTGIELEETEIQDIDTETDWKLAEIKYQYLYG